jgi:RNA polymerase sigma factor (sigma-70 family)
MSAGPPESTVARHIQTLFESGSTAGLTDAELLARFLDGSSAMAGAAFTALVERHGRMVHRVCRDALGNSDDTDDAFQATFLVLVGSARRVRNQDSVASWLHGVARRVAGRSRSEKARRRRHEHEAAMTAESRDRSEGLGPCPELHEEIARLPDRFREPIVLCYLEGLSTELAAERIGCAKGTILSRLSRARDRLRDRLKRRGITSPASLASIRIVSESATVSPDLIARTVQACLGAVGRNEIVTAAVTSSAASLLAKGVLEAMTISKIGTMCAAALAGVLALGAVPIVARQLEETAPNQAPASLSKEVRAQQDSIEKLREQIDDLTRRNQEFQSEIAGLRRTVEASQAAVGEGDARQDHAPAAEDNSNAALAQAITGARIGNLGASSPDEPVYIPMQGGIVLVVGPYGSTLSVYDVEGDRATTIRLYGTKDHPILVQPIFKGGMTVLQLSGDAIKRLAAIDSRTKSIHAQDLVVPFKGTITPMIMGDVMTCRAGDDLYTFDHSSQQWGRIRLLDSNPQNMMRFYSVRSGKNQLIAFEDGPELVLFNPRDGTSTRYDVRARIDAAIAKANVEKNPE